MDEYSIIELSNPVWQIIAHWSETRMEDLRAGREQPGADLRKLDQALGSILILQELLELPSEIRRDRNREPLPSDGFGIPTPKEY